MNRFQLVKMIGAGALSAVAAISSRLRKASISLHPRAVSQQPGSCALSARRCISAAIVPALLLAATPALGLETHGYLISWFQTATYEDYNEGCPENKNLKYGIRLTLDVRELTEIGYSEPEALAIARKGDQIDPQLAKEIAGKLRSRGRVNGMPVSPYNYPESIPAPDVEHYQGRYAHGFDLDGNKGRQDFEDPHTHLPIDNQLWRAVGCMQEFQTTPPVANFYEGLTWQQSLDSMPAWVISITGEDLSKDGKVTVTFDRVLQHPERDVAGAVLHEVTYVIDPNPRAHFMAPGQISNRILTIEPTDIALVGQLPFHAELDFKRAQLRLTVQPDGTLVGYLGGYLRWLDYAYTYTSNAGGDVLGLYHSLKKFADADADEDGTKTRISATFRLEAVPAYLANLEGRVVATVAPKMPSRSQPEEQESEPKIVATSVAEL